MRIHFGITEESRRMHWKELEKLDKKIKSYGLREISFGLYEGNIDEGDFSCAVMWVLGCPFIVEKGLFCNVWYDSENLEKENAMVAYKEVKEISNSKPLQLLKQEYNNLLKEAGLPVDCSQKK